jgi:hypothetical protein
MQKVSIQGALADPISNEKLDPNIRLSFGDSGQGGKLWTSNKKTNSVGKSTEVACNRAFMSAIFALQDRAKKEGKSSVVDIHSYYKREKFSSSTQFDCENGGMMTGVALRGRVQ